MPGVYNADSTLVRTLWSSIRYIGGTHVEKWDGLLDNRDTAPTGNYHIKVLSHNVHYSWDGGRIGNTSTALTGDSRFKSYLPPQCVAIAANRLYYGTDYQERESSQYYVDLNDLGTKYRAVTNEGTNQVTRVNCTDGNNVYWGGLLYPLQGPATGNFVFATKASDNSLVSFANGESGYRFYSAIATSPELDNVNNITSLAVQTTGNYLFVVRSETNELRVVNKTTGAFVRNITINNVYTVATDTSGKLWVATTTGSIIKYTVNGNGTLTSTGIAATGVGNAAAMTVSPDNSTLVVADNAPYVVKGFNNSAGGTAIWTLGTPGGYTTDATITNYKFDFGPASIAFQPDGSFWVLDGNNSRFQHYSSSRVFLNSISYLSSYYQTHIDPNNKNRLFASSGPNVFLEYELDYTKTLDNGQNGSWKLAKNWKLPTGLSGYYFNSAIPTVVSFAGRTFTRIKNDNTGLQDVYELVAGGQLRKTKINFASTTYFLNNGDRLENINGYAAGIAAQYKLYAFTGFDGDNDPLWTSTPYKTFNSPVTTTKDAFSGVTGEQLSNNTIYYFRNDAVAGGSGGEYHLSAFDINTSQWKFKTSIGTHNYYLGDFPNEGQFDNGNYVSRAGAYMTVNGTNLVWSYAGEFWKNEQTNYFNHFHTSGLFIGLFGRARDEFPNQIGQEGNMFSGSWVQDTPDRAYLFSGGEGKQGGIHRWRIEGLSTIQVQNCNFNPSLNYTPAQPDLMVGLIHLQQLTNGNGWTISNPSTSSLGNPAWNVLIGKQTPSLYGSQDISIYYYQNNGYDASQNRTVTRTLGTNTGLNTWKISGKISYQGGSIVGVIGGGTYFEMLDNTGKVIARLYEEEASRHSANRYIKGNGTELHAYISLDEHRTVSTKFQPFEISNNNGTLTFQYATYAAITTAIAETGADITKPTTIRLRFTPGDYQKAISIAELQFAKDTINHYRTQQSGDWADLDTWESSADSITWNDATEIPNSSANSITIRTGHTIAITGSAALDQLTIQNGAAINVAPKASLWINDGEGDDIKIVGTGKLTIQSDSSGTGRIGNSIGNINGNVVVEKYIASKNNKAYHLLAPSVNTVGGPKPYIRDNWQEGQNNTSVLTNSNTVPGYGTHITGSLLGNNGFDANALAISSLFIYNQSAASPGFVGIANTNATNLEAKKGYLLYVRGDRSIDLQTNLLSSNTTLRATGTVLIGTQTFTGLESNGRLSLVTNPYASSVNWNTIYTDASTANSANFENYCTYWDPNIGESGGYVNISVNGTKSNADNKTTEIPSGEAFFVKAKSGVTAPTFTVKGKP